MKRKALIAALLALTGWQGTATAATDSDSLAAGEIELGGTVEVEAGRGEESSDIAVATVELALTARINEKVTAEVVLLHEEDETPLQVDAATITLALRDNFQLSAGQSVAPFGLFESRLLSDPLTLELAETPATLLRADLVSGAITTSLYTFNGINADEQIDNYGIQIAYGGERLNGAVGYIANIGDSDAIAAETIGGEVAALSLALSATFGDLTLSAEHIAASDEFQGGDGPFAEAARPSASQLEIAYALGDTTLALGVQQTAEAEVLELPERRALIGVSHELYENTRVALEYADDEGYDGERSGTITAQLAVGF